MPGILASLLVHELVSRFRRRYSAPRRFQSEHTRDLYYRSLSPWRSIILMTTKLQMFVFSMSLATLLIGLPVRQYPQVTLAGNF
jgi:hypothetical protein